MDRKTVLVVSENQVDETAIDSELTEAGASVETLTDLTRLYDELTYNETYTLVLPTEIADQSGVDIARGVSQLFPDLPVVLTGTDPESVPDDLNVRATEATSIPDESVIAAIRSSLDESVPSVAARPPSPMETLLLSMFNQLPVHLYAKDVEARHVLLSRNELEPTDLIGLTDLDYTELPKEHREAAYRDEMNIIENDEPRLEIEEYTDYIDSHSLTSKAPWYDADGEVDGLVGMTQDITDRKKREHAARRQHERLVKVALVTAHEFRNELQVAHGRLDFVDDHPQLEVVERSLRRISTMVDTVVELASEERNAHERKAIWLSTLSREVWDTLDSTSATLTISEDYRVVADPESVSLFLQILFENALEHVGEDVSVSVGATDDGYYVADDGPGIDVDPPERILDAGFTTDNANTGFGLYVARSIARDHGWTISLSESDAGGTRFDIGGVTLCE